MTAIYDAFTTQYRIEYYGIPTKDEWRQNIKRWLYYSDSYQGGNEYREGTYLTKYILESSEEYENRIKQTALDNHCKSVIETYNSFLFRNPPIRTYGSIDTDPGLTPFLNDADLEGRSFDAFMRDVSTQASIYGHVWVMVDKPATQVSTRADELSQNIRPYVLMFSPENVIDWAYERQPSGVYELTMIRIFEGADDKQGYYREITKETNMLYVKKAHKDAEIIEETPNRLGIVPCIPVYSQRSRTKGVGVSDISDIADMQRSIYNELSEVEQLIRISNHPSLVKQDSVDAGAGAGAVISVPDDMVEGVKPYLLEPTGSGISNILSSIEQKANAINRMANMGGVRNTTTRTLSGLAMQTEREILNARLSEKADNLELAEERIWRLWSQWQGKDTEGLIIDYPDSFNIHDKENTVALLKLAKETKPMNPRLLEQIDILLAEAIIKDEDRLAEVKQAQMTVQQDSVAETTNQPEQMEKKLDMPHPPMENKEDMVAHMRKMIEQGYTDQEILDIHPEMSDFFNQGETSNET